MSSGPTYRRVLLKLSGEALMGAQNFGIDVSVAARISREVASVQRSGIELGIVIGGGNIFRGLAGASKGMDRAVGDQIGMLATVMNSIALRSTFNAAGADAIVMSATPMNAICEPFIRERAIDYMKSGRVVIFAAGTGSPFFTTDTAAALRAAETGCDVVIKATKVDGVYSDDPQTNPEAERYDSLTYDDVLVRGLGVMDATAIALARDNSIPIIVCSMEQDGVLLDVANGCGRYTVVRDRT